MSSPLKSLRPPFLTSILISPILLGIVWLGWTPADAYVPSTTKETGTKLRWMDSNCIHVRVNSNGSKDINDGSEILAAKRSMDNWLSRIQSCSYFKFAVLPDSPDALPSFTKSGTNENVIVWINSNWKHEKMAAAITTVFFLEKKGNPLDGRILDADMELNDQWFTFSTTGAQGKTDVENTVTHELGHVMGLDHPCYDTNLPRPNDDQGNPIPDCTAVIGSNRADYKAMREVTMYNYAEPGETKKRSPEKDDIRGICETYPTAQDPGDCQPVTYGDDDGCSVSSTKPFPGSLILWLLVLLPLALFRRSRA